VPSTDLSLKPGGVMRINQVVSEGLIPLQDLRSLRGGPFAAKETDGVVRLKGGKSLAAWTEGTADRSAAARLPGWGQPSASGKH
jgi:hypothetical protein